MPTIEKRWEPIDWSQAFGALLIDLPKVFDCFPHDFKIAKLHVWGLCISSLRSLYSYLSNWKQPSKHLLVLKMCSRRLQGIFKLCPQDVFKTSSGHVLKASSTRLQRNNFPSSKTSWRSLAKTFWRLLEDLMQDGLKTSWRREIVSLKTSWRRLENMSWRCLEDMTWRRLEDMSWRCL